MHPLKFIEPSAIRSVQMDGETLRSPGCQKCLYSFQDNLRLVIGQAAVPGWASLVTAQWAEACTKAARELFGENFDATFTSGTPDQNRKHWIRSNEIMGQIVENSQDKNLRESLEHTTRMLEQLVMNSGQFVHGLFEGVLKSLCIQAWTLIEVLLEDLHGEAIDGHPNCFPAAVLEKRERTKKSESKRFYFRTRDGFRDAYDFAFSSDPSINSAVKDPALDALAAVRHLLVHKCGIVDKGFFFDDLPKAPLLAKFPNIQKDQPLLFDGEIVREIVDAAITQGYNLLRAVDAWLLSHHLATMPNVPRTSTT